MNLFEKFLMNLHQRHNKSNFLLTYFQKLTKEKYKKLYFESGYRKELAQLFWGREGGFIHAQAKFNREDAGWKKNFLPIFEIISSEIQSRDSILEIGCSAGQWAKRLNFVKKDVTYLGIDINQQTVDFANNQFKEFTNISFICKDLGDDFDYSPFNFIMAIQVLFFLDEITVNQILGSLKKGTKIAISEPINTHHKKTLGSQNLDHKNSVGFSHDYEQLLEKHDFSINKKIIDKPGKNLYTSRIHLFAMKN